MAEASRPDDGVSRPQNERGEHDEHDSPGNDESPANRSPGLL